MSGCVPLSHNQSDTRTVALQWISPATNSNAASGWLRGSWRRYCSAGGENDLLPAPRAIVKRCHSDRKIIPTPRSPLLANSEPPPPSRGANFAPGKNGARTKSQRQTSGGNFANLFHGSALGLFICFRCFHSQPSNVAWLPRKIARFSRE